MWINKVFRFNRKLAFHLFKKAQLFIGQPWYLLPLTVRFRNSVETLRRLANYL